MNNHVFPATRYIDQVHEEPPGAQNCEGQLADHQHPEADTYIDELKDRLVLVSSSTHDFVGVLANHLPSQTQAGAHAGFILSDAHRLVKRASALPAESEMAARVLQRESLVFSKVWIPWSTVEAITSLNITPKQWRECEA